jgi:thiol-disulfide isomerase/thioredoxin
MRISLVIFLFLFSISFVGIGQIDIHINGFEGRKIELTELTDALTESYQTLAIDTVDFEGMATLPPVIQTAKEYQLRVDSRVLTLLLEPDVAYAIELTVPKYIQVKQAPIAIEQIDASGKNQIYLHEEWFAFEEDLASFITKEEAIATDTLRTYKVDSITTALNKKFEAPAIQYPWFKQSMDLELAMLKKDVLKKNSGLDSCVTGLFYLNSPRYLEALLLYYQKDIGKWLFDRHGQFQSIANSRNAIDSLMLWLNNDSIAISFPEHQELILAKLTYDKKLPKFSLANRLALLKQIGFSTENPNMELLCKNAYENLSQLIPNSLAPDIELFDKNGRSIQLSDLRGKFVYLQFWSKDNTASILDVKLLAGIQKTYRKNIQFVSIHVGSDSDNFEEYMKSHGVSWPVHHVDKDDPILAIYRIEVTPTYYLIDPNGYLLRSPAERPNRLYPLFDAINDSEVSGVKSYEIIRTYDD